MAMSKLSDRLQGTNLYLVGMMGAGKSTIGKLISQPLGYRFFDTDSVIERAAGQSISQIFALLLFSALSQKLWSIYKLFGMALQQLTTAPHQLAPDNWPLTTGP